MESVVTAPRGAFRTENSGFEELYRICRDDIYAYVLGLLRDAPLAEEVTAVAFERAFRRSATFDSRRGSRRAWLFGIARNAALDELRRRRRSAELVSEPRADIPAPEEEADMAIRRSAIDRAIRNLSARERELISLKFYAGLSLAEIGAVIGTSEAAAGMRLHRTVEKLRRACDEV